MIRCVKREQKMFRGFRSSEMLRSVGWDPVTDVSEGPIGSILKVKGVKEEGYFILEACYQLFGTGYRSRLQELRILRRRQLDP